MAAEEAGLSYSEGNSILADKLRLSVASKVEASCRLQRKGAAFFQWGSGFVGERANTELDWKRGQVVVAEEGGIVDRPWEGTREQLEAGMNGPLPGAAAGNCQSISSSARGWVEGRMVLEGVSVGHGHDRRVGPKLGFEAEAGAGRAHTYPYPCPCLTETGRSLCDSNTHRHIPVVDLDTRGCWGSSSLVCRPRDAHDLRHRKRC